MRKRFIWSIILYLPTGRANEYNNSVEKDTKAVIFNAFGILATVFILLSGPVVTPTVLYILIQVFGLLLIIWAVITIKVSKHDSKHSLPQGYFFVEKGPYEIIRHPVYAGFLLIMFSVVEIEFTFLRLVALLILCCAILMKIIREEYTMTQEVHEYKDYKKKTKAIIPYLL
jgi:protein-S-isoprenylcysteine O-methyltransferase Ste14